MKWNDGVGVGQRSINHTRVSGGSKLGTMGALYPQGRNRGTEWREEAAGGKQRTGRGSSPNVLLNSVALRLRMLWIPVVSENSQPNSQNKGLQGTAAFYRRNFQLRGGWAPNSWLAESTPGKYCSLSPVLILLGHPWLTNTREKDPRLDGCLVWPALPFLHSYLLSLVIDFYWHLNHIHLISKLSANPFSWEQHLAFSTLLATFQSFLFATEKDVSGDKSSLESSEATDKETQVYWCQGELHKLHDRLWHSHCKVQKV